MVNMHGLFIQLLRGVYKFRFPANDYIKKNMLYLNTTVIQNSPNW